jgi:hypothetical protein
MYYKYSIMPILNSVTRDGNEIVIETDSDNPDGYMLLGHFQGAHGIEYEEEVYVGPTIDSVKYIYEQITGKAYE